MKRLEFAMNRVFISFRTVPDLELASAVNAVLVAAGYATYFYPESTPLGASVRDEVREALLSCNTIVVVATPHYLEFTDSVIREDEFKYAVAERERLVLLRFRHAVLPEYASDIVFQDFRRDQRDHEFEKRLLLAMERKQQIQVRELERRQLPPWGREHAFAGRERERQWLSDAFASEECKVIWVVAHGARGKSALLRKWLDEMEDAWKRASPSAKPTTGLFVHSFAAQGAGSSDNATERLFREMLGYFLGGTPATNDARGYAAALLEALDHEKNPLIVLDGFETQLRSNGTVRDAVMGWFLEEFIARRPQRATLIITTKLMPPELEHHARDGRRVKKLALGVLDHTVSLRLLEDCGLKSKRYDLDTVAREAQGEPMCLNLVGCALAEGTYEMGQFHDDIARATFAGLLDMGAFAEQFLRSQLPRLSAAARAVLYGLSLFEEAAVSGARLRDLLFARASIPSVTKPLRRDALPGRGVFSQAAYQKGVELLRKRRLIIDDDAPDAMRSEIQVHPSVREVVRGALRAERRLWRRANWTIYRSIVRSVRRWRPDDKSELETLYSAVRFGVNAGRGVWAGWMYGLRCLRGYRAYSTNQKGMIGDDVNVMRHYYEGEFSRLREDVGLGGWERAIANSWAGLVLIGTNRLRDGHAKMREGLEDAKKNGAFVSASRTARHLAFISALMGDREESLRLARDSVELLERRRPLLVWLIDWPLIKMPHQRMSAHANLGCMLHYFGELAEAEREFIRAEAFQAAATPYPKLRAIWGYRYADLLLDLGRFDEVRDRVLDALVKPNEPKGWGEGVFAAPLLRLGYVRLRIRQADHGGEKLDWERVREFAESFKNFGDPENPEGPAESQSDAAPPPSMREWPRLNMPRRERKKTYALRLDVLIPAFRCGYAGYARLSGDLGAAEAQIARAEQAAEIAGITLFQNEIRVEKARIALARGKRAEALRELERDLEQNQVAYRRAELERLRAELRAELARSPSVAKA